MNTIIYLLQVTACTAVFYLFYFLFLSRLTFFTTNRWYLLATVLLSFLLPWLRITLNEQQPYVAAVQHIIYVQQTVPFETHTVLRQSPAIPEPIHWDAILRIAYFTMAAALCIHLLLTLFSFLKHIKGKRIAKIGKVNVLSGQQKIANGSFLNYIFLNEEELSADELQQIIAHEMLHIKLGHSVDRILVKIAQIILWFNPFIYLYARSVEENHEFEVDREIARSTDKHNYANLLLHLSVAGQGMLYHNFSKVPLKKRISMLFNKPSNKMKKITYVLIVPVVLISCLAFARLKKANNTESKNGKEKLENIIDTNQKITYRQKIKRTPAEAARYQKSQDEFAKYQQTAEYKNKMMLADAVMGKTINVTVKGAIPDKIYLGKQRAILAIYNGQELAIDSRYGQEKALVNMVKPGDQIELKVFESGVRSDYPVMITPAYVIKNKVKIFQLAEAGKIPDYPFLYEANKVRFTDGQITNIEKYPNGKWKSAVVETVNGYHFYLTFKPNAPNFTGIEDADHVRLRFINEVARGYKEYLVKNWVSITTNIKDYGIKNPELFSRFYKEEVKTPVPNNVKQTTSAAMHAADVKRRNEFENKVWEKSDDYKQQRKMIMGVVGKVITAKIKKVEGVGFIIPYNDYEYLLPTSSDQLLGNGDPTLVAQLSKLNALLATGDEIQMKVSAGGSSRGHMATLMPEYIIKNKNKIFVYNYAYRDAILKRQIADIKRKMADWQLRIRSRINKNITQQKDESIKQKERAGKQNLSTYRKNVGYDAKGIPISQQARGSITKYSDTTVKTAKEYADKVGYKNNNPSGKINSFKADTIAYSTKRFQSTPKISLVEMLGKLARFKVDEQGAIFYDGKVVSTLAINGQAQADGDVQRAIKQIPAEMINAVQVIWGADKPSVIIVNVKTKTGVDLKTTVQGSQINPYQSHFGIVTTKLIAQLDGTIKHQFVTKIISDESNVNTPIIIPFGFKSKQ